MSGPPTALAKTPSRSLDEFCERVGKVQAGRRHLRSVGRGVMRSLGSFSESDGLSQLLLRLTGNSTVYCLSEMTAPWGFQVAARSGPAFHLLTAGSAWLEVDGRKDPVRLTAGDLVI